MNNDLTTIRVREDDGVIWATFDRPDHLNAFNAALHTDLTMFLEGAAAASHAKVVVLAGAGEAFSAGGDLTWFRDMSPDELDVLFQEARRIVYALLAIEAPLVSMVQGPAVGLGATVALMSDFVLAANDAVFADPHVRIGVVAGDGGAAVWPLLCGLKRAKRYLMLGDQLDAAEAERIGLVDHVVAPDELVSSTEKIVERLRRGPQQAIRGTKKAANKHLEAAVTQTLDLSLSLEQACFESPDHREAVAAFLDKRRL